MEFITDTLIIYQQPQLSLQVLHYASEVNSIVKEKLLPPFLNIVPDSFGNFTHPPLLNMTPEVFILDLTEYYLFNALHRILYDSLMMENLHRIQHLQNAVSHLDDKTTELARKINALRQEEIIEEVEIILLNS